MCASAGAGKVRLFNSPSQKVASSYPWPIAKAPSLTGSGLDLGATQHGLYSQFLPLAQSERVACHLLVGMALTECVVQHELCRAMVKGEGLI